MANATFGANIIPKNNTVTIGNSTASWTIVNPVLTETPTAPTAPAGTNTTQIATTAFVKTAADGKVNLDQGSGNAGKYLKINAQGIVEPTEIDPSGSTPIFADKTFSIATTDWTGNGPYTKVISDSDLVANAFIWMFFDMSYEDYATALISYTKNTESITFTTSSLPTGTISGTYRIVAAIPISDAVEYLIEGKADKVSSATNGDLAALSANGNLVDSGAKVSDFATKDVATTSTAGLMSAVDKSKLDNVDKYDFNPKVMEEAILAVENCSHAKVVMNRGDTAILSGAVPAGSLIALALNGNATAVATAIKNTNTSGLATVGSVEKTIDGTIVKFSRPTLKAVQVNYEIRSEVEIDTTTLQSALETSAGTYFQSLNIGEELNPEKLRQVAMEQLGTIIAPSAVISDLYITGAHGVSRKTLVPAWNEKFTLANYAPVFLTVIYVPRFTVVNGEVCITYMEEVEQ